MRKLLSVALLCVVTLTACNNLAKKIMPSKTFVQFLADYYEDNLKENPLNATYTGDMRYNDLLPIDISRAEIDKNQTLVKKYLAELQTYDRNALDDDQKMSYDMMLWDLQLDLEGANFHNEWLPISQFEGIHLSLPQLGNGEGAQPFKTTADYDNWLKRIAHFPAYADTLIANMRIGMAKGYVLPTTLATKILPQLESVVSKDVTKSIFWGAIKNLPKTFSESDKQKYTASYKIMVERDINAPYQKIYDFIKNEYIGKCRATSGLSAVPTGSDRYKFLAKLWTTTDISPDEIFARGEKEVARIRTEMEKVKTQVGFKGDLKAFFKYVNDAPQLHPFKTPEAVLANFEAIHQRMEPKLKELFGTTPKTKFEIRRTEAFREASASAEYMQADAEGTRPGVFYVPVPDAKSYNTFQDEALFLHEAIPGHHYQMSTQQENTELPKFRRFSWYGAYGEGWALYTESLGTELGLYTDPYQYFGRLGMEMHRAIRLVVDVGMHTKGWTREQAIQYSMDNEAETEANITAEIERYMAIPGQALSYKIGQMKIAELRAKATEKMGAKFDIKEFHHTVPKYGCMPLNILEQKVDELIGK